DVDVLAIDVGTNTLWAIECKDLVFAKTPRELSSELRSLEEPTKGLIVKHQRRADWMRMNLSDVVAGLGLAGTWRVEALMTVSAPLPSAHLRPLGMPILVADDLPRWLAANAPQPARPARPSRVGAGGSRPAVKPRGRRLGRARTKRR